MDALERWLLRPLAWGAGVLVAAMMALTVADVIGRYVFNAPIAGSAEAIELALALVVFAGLPLAAVAGEHVRVAIVDPWLAPGARRVQRVAGAAVAALVSGFVAWRLAVRAAELARFGDLSSHLGVPLAWLAWFMAFGAAVAAAVFLLLARGASRERDDAL